MGLIVGREIFAERPRLPRRPARQDGRQPGLGRTPRNHPAAPALRHQHACIPRVRVRVDYLRALLWRVNMRHVYQRRERVPPSVPWPQRGVEEHDICERL